MSGRGRGDRAQGASSKRTAKSKTDSLYRRILVAAVALIVLLIVVTLAWPSATTQSTGASAPVVSADRVDVVYFHRTERCASCLWAGQTSRQTVETYFRDKLVSGRVTFQEIDVQKPENAALARKYRASGSSLFLNYVKDGQDHIVEAVETYPYVGNEVRFSGLLVAKIRAGLEAME